MQVFCRALETNTPLDPRCLIFVSCSCLAQASSPTMPNGHRAPFRVPPGPALPDRDPTVDHSSDSETTTEHKAIARRRLNAAGVRSVFLAIQNRRLLPRMFRAAPEFVRLIASYLLPVFFPIDKDGVIIPMSQGSGRIFSSSPLSPAPLRQQQLQRSKHLTRSSLLPAGLMKRSHASSLCAARPSSTRQCLLATPCHLGHFP